jgi:hypothetical protein
MLHRRQLFGLCQNIGYQHISNITTSNNENDLFNVIGFLIFGGLVFYLTSCKNKQNSKQTEDYTSKMGDTVNVHNISDNHFQNLRNMAMEMTPEQ